MSRRQFIAAMTTVSASALLARHGWREAVSTTRDQFVEVNGWILKRSDLA